MQTDTPDHRSSIRYQPDEKPPKPLAFGLGLQLAILCIAGIVLTPTIIIRAAGSTDETYLSWAVFSAVAICGITTLMQAIRVGRIGAGYVLLMGTSGAFIAVCVTALAKGGPAMLATLVVISSFFQFTFRFKALLAEAGAHPDRIGNGDHAHIGHGDAHHFRYVGTGAGRFPRLGRTGERPGHPARHRRSRPESHRTVTTLGTRHRGHRGFLGRWIFRNLRCGIVLDASWIGIPEGGWPGFDLEFGPVFWSLLPAFVFVTLVGAIETIGDAIAIQHVSWRRPRAVDFRAVQGAVAADGTGNLLSGLAGTVPNTTYSTSIAVTELTGVGARSVGVAIGLIFITVAFLPKVLAMILAIPGPVVAAYVMVLLAMLFVTGMKMVVQDGLDYRKGLIAGVAFWAGVGFQSGVIFPVYFSEFAGGLLQNGMTAGGLVAILMSLFVEWTSPRRSRVEVECDPSVLPEIREFLGKFVSRNGWDAMMAQRLDAASEETLLTLVEPDQAGEKQERRRLLLTAHKEDGGAILEFISSSDQENLQDRITLLESRSAEVEVPDEREISLRLLRHLASSVSHQQYHGTDIVTIRVETPRHDR